MAIANGLVATAVLLCAAAAPDHGAAWAPDSIEWQRAAPNGTRYALLEGDRARPGGQFTYAFFIPAGVWDGPHRHSTTARVFVARGELAIGYDTVADRAAAQRYPAGSIVVVPAGAVHFDGAERDTILIGVASGPWATRYADGAAPASAGTPLRPAQPSGTSRSGKASFGRGIGQACHCAPAPGSSSIR